MATFECATNILMALGSAVDDKGANASDILVNRSLLNKARYEFSLRVILSHCSLISALKFCFKETVLTYLLLYCR